jgi:Domain of Unknown Function (DUF1521)
VTNVQGFGGGAHFHHGHNNGLANIIEGAIMDVARGILGQFFNNLNCGPLAHPCLPKFFDVRCGTIAPGGCMPEPKAQWTAQMTGSNTATVNLGDGYRLEIDERSSQMTIVNDATGERTRIWGDPHVEIDGKHAYDFWGTTTFTLGNGTKITINTEQWQGNPNAYVASQVVVTKGSNALIIDGISQNKLGDLSVSLSNNGYAVDAAHRDGFTLAENMNGSGWLNEGGAVATQNDLNATAVGREYGPGSALPSLGELGERLGAYLLFGALMGFLGGAGGGHSQDHEHHHHHRPNHGPRDFFRHTMIP